MNSDPVLVFNHIPKCYGQSLRHYFRQFMATHTDYESVFANAEDFRKYPYDPSTLVADDLLLGHFTSNTVALAERYPEVWANPRFRLFTFVREPMQRQISQYYYSLRPRPEPVQRKAEYTLSIVLRRTSNAIASCFPCTEETCDDVLARYFFLGVAERHEESLKVLVERIYRIYAESPKTPAVDRMLKSMERLRGKGLPHQNRTARDKEAEAIDDDAVETFRRNNALDRRIYEIAQRRLDADLKELDLNENLPT